MTSPRWTEDGGLLIEEQRTNFLPNSDRPENLTLVTLMPGDYSVSCRRGYLIAYVPPFKLTVGRMRVRRPLRCVLRAWWRGTLSEEIYRPRTCWLFSLGAKAAQVEDGFFSTSYISTGLGPATRAADHVSPDLGWFEGRD